MRILKALSLTFALGVLALAMLGASGTTNAQPSKTADAGAPDGGAKAVKLYMHSTKSGPMPLQREPEPQPQPQPTK